MKFKKRLLFSIFIYLTLSAGSAFADTCYDPRYGYYECNPNYSSYPDQGQAFMESAILGIFLGSLINDEGYKDRYHRDRDRDRDHEHWDRHRDHHY